MAPTNDGDKLGRKRQKAGGGGVHWSYVDPEMKFLDINLTKDFSLLLHAIHSPFGF
jgi:hypothetical protein